MEKFKSKIAIILIMAMIIPILPINEIKAYAAGDEILSVRVSYIYEEGSFSKLKEVNLFISMTSTDVGEKDAYIFLKDGQMVELKGLNVETPGGVANKSFKLDFNKEEDVRVSTVQIGSKNITLQEKDIVGTVKEISTRDVGVGDTFTIQGSDLDPDNIKIDASDYDVTVNGKTSASIEMKSGATGKKSIRLEKSVENDKVVQISNYPGAFNLIGKFENIKTIDVVPDTGSNGSIAYLVAKENGKFNIESGKANHSIFFLKDKTDTYKKENMARIISATDNVLKLEVPLGIPSDSYEVYLTNNVDDRKEIPGQIHSRMKAMRKYNVIVGDMYPVVTSINPSEGSDRGEEITVSGDKFWQLDFINELEGTEKVSLDDLEVSKEDKKMSNELDEILGIEGGVAGNRTDKVVEIKYNDFGNMTYRKEGSDTPVGVTGITRYIATYIGGQTEPVVDEDNNPIVSDQSGDSIKVKTGTVNVSEDQRANVIMMIQTEIILADGTSETKVVMANSSGVYYTINPSHILPQINSIKPNKILVEPDGADYTLKDKISFKIEGENFSVMKGKGSYNNYPIVGIGATTMDPKYGIVLKVNPEKISEILYLKNDKTWEVLDGATLKVVDAKGKIVDGTLNNSIGNTIYIDLPKKSIIKIDKDSVASGEQAIDRPLYIMNPIKNQDNHGSPIGNTKVAVNFIEREEGKLPRINSVDPEIMGVESGSKIRVTGTNFEAVKKVYLRGNEIPVDYQISQDGKTHFIEFDAPKRPEQNIIAGKTSIILMTENGEMASVDFEYIDSEYKAPIITNYNPKIGTGGTKVVIKGNNYVKPDPTAEHKEMSGFKRLTGTTVLFQGIDINQYNDIGADGSRLKNYSNGENQLIYVEDGMLKLADYAHSIFVENKNKLYSVSEGDLGAIYITDNTSDDETNTLNTYRISIEQDKIIATKGTKSYPVVPTSDGVKIGAEDFKMKTPYKANGTDIYGSRVEVVSKDEIRVTIPDMDFYKKEESGNTSKEIPTATGEYSITVVNPDTKQATAKEKFYYYASVLREPLITSIEPKEGMVSGGYEVVIKGTNINPDAQLFVDSYEIKEADYKISVSGNQATINISNFPKYMGDLQEEKLNRKSVVVSVANDNGGTSAAFFTYIIPPMSPPKVSDYLLRDSENEKEAIAGGGQILMILGSDISYEEPNDINPKDITWKQDPETGRYYRDLDGDGKITKYKDTDDYKEQEKKKPNGGAVEKLDSKVGEFTEHLTSRVLPEVYVGNKKAKIVAFNHNSITVITPNLPAGKHQIYVKNNDLGASNRLDIPFTESKIMIDDISPKMVDVDGTDKIDITGRGFKNSELKVFEKDKFVNKTMPQVKIGDDIHKEVVGATGAGRFNIAGLDVFYDSTGINDNLNLKIKSVDGSEYNKTINLKDEKTEEGVFIPLNELRDSNNKPYESKEMIKFTSDESGLKTIVVERGYVSDSKITNKFGTMAESGTIRIEKFGDGTRNKKVYFINPDGAKANKEVSFGKIPKRPEITNISDGVKDSQGLYITTVNTGNRDRKEMALYGNNFILEGATGKKGTLKIVGNNGVINITEGMGENGELIVERNTDPEIVGEHVIRFWIPANLPAKYDDETIYAVIIENADGGSANSLRPKTENEQRRGIKFESGITDPMISDLEPSEGPVGGGTRVFIKGTDFHKDMLPIFPGDIVVKFGTKEVTRPIEITEKGIYVYAPEGVAPGEVEVTVRNPDGQEAASGNFKFKYISKPVIEDVTPKKIFTNDTKTKVKIYGQQLMPGAKVIIGGKIITIKKDDPIKDKEQGRGISGVDSDGRNIMSAVVGGAETATAVLKEDNDGKIYLEVTFNEVTDLENTDLIIINKDGGISEPYKDFKHELPLPLKPLVLEGIPGYESTVMLIWSESDPELLNRSTEFEIYGRKVTDKENVFIGTTKDAQFLVKGLEPNTEYEFLVRALNEYGAAVDFATVRVRTLSAAEDHKQQDKEEQLEKDLQEIEEKGKETISGNTVTLVLGKEILKKPLIDLSLTKYKNANEFIIKIPLALARQDSVLTIKDGTMTMNINPKDLYTFEVSNMDTGDKGAVVQVEVRRERSQNIPRGKKVASREYGLDFKYQAGKNILEIEKLLRNGQLNMEVDNALYRDVKNPYIAKFDIKTGQYVKASDSKQIPFNTSGKYIILSDR